MNMKPLGRALLALVALCTVGAATPTPPTFEATAQEIAQEVRVEPPVTDPTEEDVRRFPNAKPEHIRALHIINRSVNNAITYTRDIDQYGVSEKWVWLPESRRGDCEDYALSKLAILQKAGFPIVSRARITMLYAKGVGHAVLEVNIPGAGVLVMDNNFDRLMTRAELIMNHGYSFQDW